MKILFYADTVFGFGGVQRVLSVISQTLSKNHDVSILSTDKNVDMSIYGYDKFPIQFRYITYESAHDLQYFWCKMLSMFYKKLLPRNAITARLYSYSFFLPRYKKALITEINSRNYDVVIGVHAFLSLHLASIRAKLGAGMTIGWMHNSYEALFEKKNPYLPHLREFFSFEIKKLDKVVVLSRCDAISFSERLGIDAITIYNPLTLKPCGRGKASNKRFLAVGRFSPLHKGFDLLIKAFAIFAETNSDWTLEIVGEGEEEPLYRRLIAESGLEKRIIISPFTSDIQSHYAAASVYVLSSRWEGFGLVLVEAMSHGLPIIASDVPVACELLEGRNIAVFFPRCNIMELADVMGKMADRSDLDAMGDRAIEYSSQFSIKDISQRWEQVVGGYR